MGQSIKGQVRTTPIVVKAGVTTETASVDTIGNQRTSSSATVVLNVDLSVTDVTFTSPTKRIYVTTTGNLVFTTSGNATPVTWTGIPAGYHEIEIVKITKTGTTAAGIVAHL